MNSMARDRQAVVAFSASKAAELVQALRAMPASRWFHRTQINSRPTQGSRDCDYHFLGDRQQPKDFNKALRQLAPHIEGAWLGEACINRYDVGGYMPEHVDIAMYRYNMVIALSDLGDGFKAGELFIPDQPGQGFIFPARSEPHSVPPVKHERFVAIFLYE